MTQDVRTRAGLVRRIGYVTLLSVGASVLATAIVFPLVFGCDLARTFTGYRAVAISAVLSVCVPAIATPLISYRACMLMRGVQIARDEFERLSRIDQLTGLPNRRGFDEIVRAELDRAASGAPVSALMLDIDSFKPLNDTFGHEFGDAVLTRVADILRDSTDGARAVLGRQGGDEFAVVLIGADRDVACSVGERIRAHCAARPVAQGERSAIIRVSVGVATLERDEAFPHLMGRADACLISAKRSGRDRVCCAGDVVEGA